MEGSRLRILKLLQQHNHVTVERLSQQMGLASATVRRHLDILQRDQLVSFEQVKKKTGRPEYAFYLTETGQETLPKDYDRFLTHLLQELSTLSRQEIGGLSGEGVLDLVFQRMAQHTVGQVEHKPKGSLEDCLATAVAFLEEEKFAPEVERIDGLVRIHIHNCPVRAVALRSSAVCTYHLLILSSLLGADVQQEQRIPDGGDACCYTVPISAP